MKKHTPPLLTLTLTLTLAGIMGSAQAATIVVNSADNTNFGAGVTNLVRALTSVNDGDTIAFNIPGEGPHFLETPVGGFPLLIKDRVTIDGYSQPGASPNTNPITASNNAVIKIVLDSRNGNYRDMEYPLFTPANSSPPIDNSAMSTERGGYGFPERAVLGIYRATNVNVRGLAFLGNESLPSNGEYGIAVAHDYGGDTAVKDRLAYHEGSSRNCHINGCWFGINPTNQTEAGLTRFAAAVAFFRHREANPPVVPAARPELPNESLTVGVKAGSANPRAEFNVFAYHGYALAGEAIRTRFSGNFLGVMPDGVTPTPILPGGFAAGAEIGRYDDTLPMVIGTDGDGINDWDEGNLIGPLLEGGAAFDFYSTGNKQYIVAGNRFGMGVDGTRWTNSQTVFAGFAGATRVQFGSDLNGVSDAAEANVVYNHHPFAELFPDPSLGLALPPRFFEPSTGTQISMRGNVLVNNGLVPFDYADFQFGRVTAFTNYSAPYMDVTGPIIPALSANSTTDRLVGTCALGIGSYTNIIIDVYLADPEGLASGRAFQMIELMPDGVTNGFPQGQTYLGSFVDNGPWDSDPTVGAFDLNVASLHIPLNALVTVSANYSADPPGTTRGRTHTSNFANPVPVGIPPNVIYVTSSDSGSANGFSTALLNVQDGGQIRFNIPGEGPHFLETPVGGFPLVIKDNVTIDGYSQPGASPNSNPLTMSNNAVIKIVLDSRNGNYRDMEYPLFTLANSSPPIDNTAMSTERGGYGFPERAVLGIYRATNVNVRGLALLGTESGPTGGEYGIAVAHDYGGDTAVKDRLAYNEGSSRNCHINGCWIGINPTNPTVEGVRIFQDAVAFFRHREANPPVVPVARPELPNESLILGVKPGSTNPRAEFNVIPYMVYITAGEAVRTRVSGNFLGVMPDGVTPSGVPSAFEAGLEIGRYDDTLPIVLGTDGDGTNDWDEGNLIGPLLEGQVVFGFYSTANKPYIMAGNQFGMGVDGTRWTNSQTIFSGFGSATRVQFGSDLNGVSDAAEANVVYNHHPFAELFPDPSLGLALPPRFMVPSAGTQVSFRGNSLVNNGLVPFDYADFQFGRVTAFTNYSAPYMNVTGPIIPALSEASSGALLIGSCAPGTGSYTNIVIDVYLADPEGLASGRAFQMIELMPDGVTNGFPQGQTYLGSFVDNGPADSNPAVGAFSLNIASLNVPSGALVTVAANYSADPPGTTRGRTHTSNFANPVTLLSALSITSVSRSGSTLTITWSGGSPPYSLQRKSPITGAWVPVASGLTGSSTTDTMTSSNAFYRISSP